MRPREISKMGDDRRSDKKDGAVSTPGAAAFNSAPSDTAEVSLRAGISLPEASAPGAPGIAALAASAAVARAMGDRSAGAAHIPPEAPPSSKPGVSSPALTAPPLQNIAAQAAEAAETLAVNYTALLKGSASPASSNKPAPSQPAPQQAENQAARALQEPVFEPAQVSASAPDPKTQIVARTLAAQTAQAAIVRAKAYDAGTTSDAARVDSIASAVARVEVDGDAIANTAAAAGLPTSDTVAAAPAPAATPAPTASPAPTPVQAAAQPSQLPQLPQVSLASLPTALSDAIADFERNALPSASAQIAKPAARKGAALVRADEPGPQAEPAFTPTLSVVTIAPPSRAAAAVDRIDYTARFLRSEKPQAKLPPPQVQRQLLPPSSEPPPPHHSGIETSETSGAAATASFAAPAPTAMPETSQAEAIPASAVIHSAPSAAALRQQLAVATPIGQDIVLPPLRDRADRQQRQDTSALPRRAFWRLALSWLRKLFKIAAFAAVGYGVLCVALIFVYRFVDPPTSNLMLWQRLTGTTPLREWVALDKISPNLIKAVIASEDARFCYHGGVDFKALRFALRQTGKRHGRGASTISMQVTKNLFLWNSRSYVRKAIEIPMTMLMELIWPKWRVLEVYLNIAEWGEGVFGAQAASAYHFSRPARRLSLRQAALLVVLLPNPVSREAGDPTRATRRRAARIEKRVKASANVANCVLN